MNQMIGSPVGERLVIGDQSEGVVLKQYVPEDAPALFSLIDRNREFLKQNRPELERAHPTINSTRKIIANCGDDEDFLHFGIWDKGILSGSRRMQLDEYGTLGTLDCWVSPEFSGRGLSARSARILARFAFNQMHMEKLTASTSMSNIASARSLQKAGFRWVETPDSSWGFILHAGELDQPAPPALTLLEKVSGDQDKNISIAKVGLKGMSLPTINHGSRLRYEVDEGYAHFVVNNEGGQGSEISYLGEGHVIDIPEGRRHQIIGEATLKAVYEPAFDLAKVAYLS